MDEAKGWYSRGYLPHFDGGPVPQMVTLRLHGSLPRERLDQWRSELQHLPDAESFQEYRRRIEEYLDCGEGNTWLALPEVAHRVQRAFWHFDGCRYQLHAWTIMPNHVHTLLTPARKYLLGKIIQGWKSVTSRECKRLLRLDGAFWQPDYFDRYIRDERHFATAVEYIEFNPVQAGLCSRADQWQFSSAFHRSREPAR